MVYNYSIEQIKKEWNILLVLIILGISAVCIAFGVVYDYFFRKSFKETKRGPANLNDGQVKLDVATYQAVNTMNMP